MSRRRTPSSAHMGASTTPCARFVTVVCKIRNRTWSIGCPINIIVNNIYALYQWHFSCLVVTVLRHHVNETPAYAGINAGNPYLIRWSDHGNGSAEASP